MRNPAMNFGLVFETILAAYICYLPGVGDALGTRPIRLIHWAPAVPFSVAIFWYDETRKKIMRETSPAMLVGKQVIRDYGKPRERVRVYVPLFSYTLLRLVLLLLFANSLQAGWRAAHTIRRV